MGVYYYEICTKLEYYINFEIYLTISPNIQKTFSTIFYRHVLFSLICK